MITKSLKKRRYIMRKSTLSSISRMICLLLVFTLVVSCLPKHEWAEATGTSNTTEQASSITESQDATHINKEITINQPDGSAPSVDLVQKGPVANQQEENAEVTQNGEGDYTKKVYLDP